LLTDKQTNKQRRKHTLLDLAAVATVWTKH